MAAAGRPPFADTAEYLEAVCRTVRERLERAIALAEGQSAEALTARVQAREEELRTRGTDGVGLPGLAKRFLLTGPELAVLEHAVAAQLDPSLGKLHTRLSGAPFHPWLDVGLWSQVAHDGLAERLRAWALFQPEAPLLRHRLITLDRARPEARDSLSACEIKLPPRVARLILGSDPSGGVATAGRLIEPTVELDRVVLSDEAQAELAQLLRAQPGLGRRLSAWGYDALLPARAVVVLVTGAPGAGKTMLATGMARRLARKLMIIDGARLAESGRALETQLEELLLEARLADAVVLVEPCEPLFGGDGARVLFRALDSFEGLVVLATSHPERLDATVDQRVLLRLALELPTAPLRERIWRQLLLPDLPLAADVDVGQLAKRYELLGGAIRAAVLYAVSKVVARSPAGERAELTQADLDAAAQTQLRGDLSTWADSTHPSRLSLAALVLPAEERAQLEEIIAAGRNRHKVLHGWGFAEKLPTGKGLVVLLSGEPGTGKTLAAEVIAAELGLKLYRINPAKVVSKYVGETEKNLNEILAQARSTHAILFFDEADALFSSRVAKVETANDRFVNMETNFLLQQLERYEGIVILATNLETSIDQAFKRRIAYHVVVPFPKAVERELIWRSLLPSRVPTDEIDFARLGKVFELSGGHIKNATLRAAYLAAQRDRPLDFELLAEAAEKECVAAGKLFQSQVSTPRR